MSFWACAQTECRRETTAELFLGRAGYKTYLPRIRLPRTTPTRGVVASAVMFPSYIFIWIEAQWWAAKGCPGVVRLIASGSGVEPEHVPPRVIDELRKREVCGLIELPQKPGLRRGNAVRIIRGPMANRLAIYEGMKGRERVEVLLAMLGSVQRVELARRDIAPTATASSR